jgi:hypothetical protein
MKVIIDKLGKDFEGCGIDQFEGTTSALARRD